MAQYSTVEVVAGCDVSVSTLVLYCNSFSQAPHENIDVLNLGPSIGTFVHQMNLPSLF